MKITKSKLHKIIKEEVLREISSSVGGKGAIQRQQKAKSDVKTARTDKTSKKATYDTKKRAFTTKDTSVKTKEAEVTKKDADYNLKDTRVSQWAAREPDQFRYREGDRPSGRWFTNPNDPQRKYPNTSERNPEWITWNNEKGLRDRAKAAAETARTRARAEKSNADKDRTAALKDRDAAEKLYNQAVKNLTAAEKAEMAAKAQTGFGFGAGGGGRGAGKGGTAKKGGKKGKKDESLFRILGRDLIKELKDIEKYR